MKEFNGYAGTILEVNLSEDRITKTPVEDKLVKNFIGGIGFSTKLLYDRMESGVDALSPGNVFVIGSGPLAGTLAPTATRAEIDLQASGSPGNRCVKISCAMVATSPAAAAAQKEERRCNRRATEPMGIRVTIQPSRT